MMGLKTCRGRWNGRSRKWCEMLAWLAVLALPLLSKPSPFETFYFAKFGLREIQKELKVKYLHGKLHSAPTKWSLVAQIRNSEPTYVQYAGLCVSDDAKLPSLAICCLTLGGCGVCCAAAINCRQSLQLTAALGVGSRQLIDRKKSRSITEK